MEKDWRDGVRANWIELIFTEISDKRFKRKDIAKTYRLILEGQRDQADFAKINAAIIERWSISGLVYIKELAWGDKVFDTA